MLRYREKLNKVEYVEDHEEDKCNFSKNELYILKSEVEEMMNEIENALNKIDTSREATLEQIDNEIQEIAGWLY